MRTFLSIIIALGCAIGAPAAVNVTKVFSWNDNSDNELGFRLLVSATPDMAAPSVLAETPANVGNVLGTLPAGQRHYVVVIAWNTYGESEPSNMLTVDLRPPTGPSGLTGGEEQVTTVQGTLRIEGDLEVAGVIREGGKPPN